MLRYSLLLVVLLTCQHSTSKDLEWWEGGNFYQIYPRSFMDSNDDGVGDLLGIASKVAYLKEIGMDGVWLSPIMKSPQYDYGYDISDYRDIHDQYGTLEDFDELVKACENNGVKLILDLVPNHSSHLHDWFKKSENREAGYENYYLWHPGSFDPIKGERVPPNNWVSVFRFPGWKWSEKRKQFYYHAFLAEQPDLNYRNPKVVQEMKDVMSYWLHRGVQGFRIDAVPFLFEANKDFDGQYPDEPLTGNSCPNPDDYCYTQHVYTNDRDETFDMIYQWRALANEISKSDGNVRILMTEAYTSLPNMIKFYGDGRRNGSHIPFNFEVISYVNDKSTAKEYKTRIDNWLERVPAGSQANWVLGNHDQHRVATRLGVTRTDLINIMLQTLPGVAVTYQGEELGLKNTHLSWEDTVDPSACNTNDPINYEASSRDGCRTPFPWAGDLKNGGFSKADSTWLPINPDYTDGFNVKSQEEATNSHLKIFKRLTKLRKQNVLRQGTYKSKLTNNENVIVYLRKHESNWAVVILNFGANAETVNVKAAFPDELTLPTQLPVYAASLDTLANGATQTLSAVVVQSDKAVVLSNIKYEDLIVA